MEISFNSKTVLISTNYFQDFAGSEIVSLELIEWFIGKGATVHLYTTKFGSPMAEVVDNYINNDLLTVYKIPNQPNFLNTQYDIIWINHSLIPVSLFEQLDSVGYPSTLIWLHLGVLPALEQPILAEFEILFSDYILGVSKEVIKNVQSYFDFTVQAKIFDNPAPRAFCEYPAIAPSPDLTRVAVISNHPPKEIVQAMSYLASTGLHVEYFGLGRNSVRITPEIINSFDLIVTIGKSVQYGLVMGKAVYCYDHFGGCGYLNQTNFERESDFNFSGRATCRQIDSSQIVNEIMDGYNAACIYSQELKNYFQSKWNLDQHLIKFFQNPGISLNSRTQDKNQVKRARAISELRLLLDVQLSSTSNSCYEIQKNKDHLLHENSLLSEAISEKGVIIDRMQKSLSWRLTKPLRRANKYFKKINFLHSKS